MLAKSIRSAFIMASILLLTAATTSVAITAAIEGSEASSSLEDVRNAPFGLPVVLGVLAIALFAMIIYRFDESHFGFQGAIRWGLTGIVLAAILKGLLLLLSPFDESFLGSLPETFLPFLTGVLAYWTVFRLFPRGTGETAKEQEATQRDRGSSEKKAG